MDELTKAEISQQVGAAVSASRSELLTQLDSLMTSKLGRFEAQIADTQKNISESQLTKIQQGIACADNFKFTKKSCEQQHKFNSKVLSTLHEARQANQASDAQGTHDRITEGINLMTFRQKLIKLADSSDAGWKTVDEYVTNPIASDSDDEKRMDRAMSRANRKAKTQKQKPRRFEKDRFHPYGVGAWDTRVTTTGGQAVTDRPPMLKPQPRRFQKDRFHPYFL